MVKIGGDFGCRRGFQIKGVISHTYGGKNSTMRLLRRNFRFSLLANQKNKVDLFFGGIAIANRSLPARDMNATDKEPRVPVYKFFESNAID
jgi:hypothetical protein